MELFDPVINISELNGYPFSPEKDYDDILIFYTGAFGGLTGPLEKDSLYKASVFVERMIPFYSKCVRHQNHSTVEEEDGLMNNDFSVFDLWDWLKFSGAKLHSFRGSQIVYSNTQVTCK